MDVEISPQALTQTAREKLKQIIAQIEKHEADKRELSADIKDVYAEAKAFGYDTKALRRVIAFRRQDRREREEQEQVVDLYLHAIGEV